MSMQISSVQSNVSSEKISGRQVERAAKVEEKTQAVQAVPEQEEEEQSLIDSASEGLMNVSSALQRMKELSIEASTEDKDRSYSDKANIQKEINQLKEQITVVSKDTKLNTKKPEEFSMASEELAANPTGGRLSIRTTDSTVESLGLADYDVTGEFDVADVDKAMDTVNAAREALSGNSRVADYNMNSSGHNGKVTDLDAERAITERDQQQAVNNYQYFMLNQ